MSTPSTGSLIDALRQVGLLESEQLNEASGWRERFADSKAMARELLKRGWLTPYQANQLLQGRGAELTLGSYVLLERIGEGGMGAVFKARHRTLGRIVALKLIRKDRLSNTQAVKRFHREIRAAAKLNHPNIVLAYDADEAGGNHFFAMEYVPGIDLSQLVQAEGPLPVPLACDFIRQAALGLQHAYERGMVHRDIKPANLLVTRTRSPAAKGQATKPGGSTSSVSLQSVVKLLDLGLARLEHSAEENSGTLTQEGSVMGTPDYLAPEQALDSHHVDIRSDLYSLGCTLYFLLTGRVPYPGGTMAEKLIKHQMQEVEPVERLRPDVPPGVAAIVRKLMAKRPEDRYQTPTELAAALGAAPASGVVPGVHLSSASPARTAAQSSTPFFNMDTRSDAAPSGAPAPVDPFAAMTEGPSTEVSSPRRTQRTPAVRPKMSVPRWALIGGGAALGLLILLVAILGWRTRSEDGTRPANASSGKTPEPGVKVAVAADRPWQDTGLDLEPGRQVTVAATGRWGRKGQAAGSSAGSKDLPRDRTVLPTAPALSLVGRVGNAPRLIAMGPLTSFVPEQGGRLYLQINDLDLDADTGSLEVEINGGRRGEPVPPPGPTFIEQAEAELKPLIARAAAAGNDVEALRQDLLTFQRKFPGTPQAPRAGGLRGRLPSAPDRLDPAGIPAERRLPGQPAELVAVLGEPVWRHGGTVLAVAVSPDGRLVASGGADGFVWLRQAGTGQRHLVLSSNNNVPVRMVQFAPNGQTLATGNDAGVVKLWDVASGQERASIQAHGGMVRAGAFSPDGKWLATGGHEGDFQLKLWNLETRQSIYTVKADSEQVVAMALSPDGMTLATGGKDAAKLWDLATGKERATLTGHTSYVHGVAFSPDGTTLATAGFQDRTVRLWDLATNKERAILQGHGNDTYFVAFAPDGRTLASTSADGTVRLWDPGNGRELAQFQGHRDAVLPVTYFPDGRTIVTGGNGGCLRFWDTALLQDTTVLEGHGGWVHGIAFSPDGNTLASAGGEDRSIRLWDVATSKETAVRSLHMEFVSTVAYAPDGKTFASGSGDNTIKIWDATTARVLATLTGHEGRINQVAFAPDGQTLASAADDRTVRLWDLTTREQRLSLTAHGDAVHTVAFSSDGKTLASGSGDRTVRLWDAGTGKERAVLRGYRELVASVAFSPDGKTLAAGSFDRTLRLYEAATGRVLAILKGHPEGITAVAYAPDGKSLAVGLGGGAVWLWDPVAQQAQATPRKHTGWVRTLAFAPDGKTLATAAQDRTIRLWKVPPVREQLPGQRTLVRSVAFSPTCELVAAGDQDGRVWVYNATTGKLRHVLAGNSGPVVSLAFLADGKSLAAGMGGDDSSVRIWDVVAGAEVTAFGDEALYNLELSADGKTLGLATGSALRLFRTGGWDDITPLDRVQSNLAVVGLALAPDGAALAALLPDRSVELIAASAGPSRPALRGPGQTYSLAFAPDGRTLATGQAGEATGIQLWSADSGQRLQMLPRAEAPWITTWAPDGKTFVTKEGSSRLAVLDAVGNSPTREWLLPVPVWGMALASDGRHVATANADGTVYIVRLAPPR